MRIAQIMLGRRFGGAERSFIDLSQGLAERGVEVLAIGDPRGAAFAKLTPHSNLRLEGITCHGVWDPLCRGRIRRSLQRFAPDLAHMHLARAAHLGGGAARACTIPTLAKTHTLVNLKYYRHIDQFVATTNEQKAYLLAQGVAPRAVIQIPNFSALDPVEGRACSPGERLVIKSFGRFVHKKGFDVLLHAFARVLGAGIDARLEIAGAGPEQRSLTALAGELGLGERVQFPGWTDDVRVFLAGAHLFVLPSREEPFGIALLEAMACGVPIVSSRASGPVEVLGEGTALLVDGDGPEIAAAIIDIARRPDAAAGRARLAQQRYCENFDARTVIGRYVDLYETLTKR